LILDKSGKTSGGRRDFFEKKSLLPPHPYPLQKTLKRIGVFLFYRYAAKVTKQNAGYTILGKGDH